MFIPSLTDHHHHLYPQVKWNFLGVGLGFAGVLSSIHLATGLTVATVAMLFFSKCVIDENFFDFNSQIFHRVIVPIKEFGRENEKCMNLISISVSLVVVGIIVTGMPFCIPISVGLTGSTALVLYIMGKTLRPLDQRGYS